MKLDAFHCALLVAIVLLAVYVARGSSLEANWNPTLKSLWTQRCEKSNWSTVGC